MESLRKEVHLTWKATAAKAAPYAYAAIPPQGVTAVAAAFGRDPSPSSFPRSTKEPFLETGVFNEPEGFSSQQHRPQRLSFSARTKTLCGAALRFGDALDFQPPFMTASEQTPLFESLKVIPYRRLSHLRRGQPVYEPREVAYFVKGDLPRSYTYSGKTIQGVDVAMTPVGVSTAVTLGACPPPAGAETRTLGGVRLV